MCKAYRHLTHDMMHTGVITVHVNVIPTWYKIGNAIFDPISVTKMIPIVMSVSRCH